MGDACVVPSKSSRTKLLAPSSRVLAREGCAVFYYFCLFVVVPPQSSLYCEFVLVVELHADKEQALLIMEMKLRYPGNAARRPG